MTDETDALGDVAQDARNAAADYYHVNGTGPLQGRWVVAAEMRAGEHDKDPLVKAFARYGIEQRNAGREEAAKLVGIAASTVLNASHAAILRKTEQMLMASKEPEL